MTYSRNPIGLHIQRMASPNDDWVRDHVQKAQYMSCTSLDASGMAADLQRLGVQYSVARMYSYEPDPTKLTDENAIKAFAEAQYKTVSGWARASGNDRIHMYINNEQGHSWQRLVMYRFMIEAAVQDPQGPVGMVFLNGSPGNIKTGYWNERNEFQDTEFMKLLIILDKYRNIRLKSGAYAFILGVHNYTSQYWWIAVNAGAHRIPLWDIPNQFDNGELHIDWSKAQDHLGREYQGIRYALGYVWDDNKRTWLASANVKRRPDGTFVEPPWILVTECLFDNMEDVRNVHKDVIVDPVLNPDDPHKLPETNPRGYHTLATQWSKWFQDTPGHTLVRMLQGAWKPVYEPEGSFIGLNNFCFGNTGGHDTYTVTPKAVADPAYFNAMTPYRRLIPRHFFAATPFIPLPDPIPLPPPTGEPPMPDPTPTPAPTPAPVVFPNEVVVKIEIGVNLLTLLLALINKDVNGVALDAKQTP